MDLADTERHHAMRDDFLHLSDLEWSAVQCMAEIIGNPAVGAMFLSLSGDEQHAIIAKFIQHELDEVKRKLTLLQEQGWVDLLREQGDQQADLLMQQGAQHSELLRQQKSSAVAAG